ncbi:MAG: hypothetical protein P8126_02940 [Gammaproteobacteria bacterium]
MSYDSLIFLLLASALLAYLAFRLGISIYVDYNGAAQVRRQLLQRLKLLQLRPLLRSQGMNDTEFLYLRPLFEVEQIIRPCENCALKQECALKVARGQHEFNACPLQQCISGDSAESK